MMITSTNPMVYTNPVVYTDFPDPDIIRVGDVYYMATTTMHFTPGCDILRSYDLVHWEFIAYGVPLNRGLIVRVMFQRVRKLLQRLS